MKTKTTLTLLAILGALALTANAQDNAPTNPPDAQPPMQHTDGSGAPRGGFHLVPPPVARQLNLTDDQKTQIAALEADTKAKLAKILTSDQMAKVNSFRPPGGMGGQRMRGGHGQGGPGGGDEMPPGPPSGPGGDDQGGPPPQQ
jgi:hypothetical protein